mgnify:CR=1 FL=1
MTDIPPRAEAALDALVRLLARVQVDRERRAEERRRRFSRRWLLRGDHPLDAHPA